MMFLRRLSTAFILIVGLLLGLVSMTSAGIPDGLAFSVACGGFVSQGGTLILDRDNTGNNREIFTITATDGDGNEIFVPIVDSYLIGGELSLPAGTFFAWTSTPMANPLTLEVISPAGNELEEQVIYETTGECPSLYVTGGGGTGGVTGDVMDAVTTSHLPADGVTGPSVPLNASPPRPDNVTEVVQMQEGWLIVDTDNLNLRTGDNAKYTVVGILDGGTELFVLGRNLKRSWWYVQAGELRGWVNNEHVAVRGDLTNIPVVRSLGVLIPPTYVVYGNTPVYSSPAKRSAVLCNLEASHEYEIIGRNIDRTWYQIEAVCDDFVVVGWVETELGMIRNPAKLAAPVTG